MRGLPPDPKVPFAHLKSLLNLKKVYFSGKKTTYRVDISQIGCKVISVFRKWGISSVWLERLHGMQKVIGSSPICSTTPFPIAVMSFRFTAFLFPHKSLKLAELRGELQVMFNAKTLQEARKKRDGHLDFYRDVAESAMTYLTCLTCLDEGFENAMTVMILLTGMRRFYQTSNYMERLNKESLFTKIH